MSPAEPKVVFTPTESFVWDVSSMMYDAREVLLGGSPSYEALLRVVEKASALNKYDDLMRSL